MSLVINIDRRSTLSMDRQIGNQIRRAILNRELYINRPLDRPQQVASELGIDVNEVKQAYQTLINENLLVLDHFGHYKVKFLDAPNNVLINFTSVFEGIRLMGLEPSIETLHTEVVKADSIKNCPVDFKSEKLLHIQRLYLGNDKPMAWIDSYFSLEVFPDLDQKNFGNQPSYDLFEQIYGIKPGQNTRIFGAGLASKEQAQALQILDKAPLFTIDLFVYDQYHRPMELSKAFFFENFQMEWTLEGNQLEDFY